jgi:hypothetical protein
LRNLEEVLPLPITFVKLRYSSGDTFANLRTTIYGTRSALIRYKISGVFYQPVRA